MWACVDHSPSNHRKRWIKKGSSELEAGTVSPFVILQVGTIFGIPILNSKQSYIFYSCFLCDLGACSDYLRENMQVVILVTENFPTVHQRFSPTSDWQLGILHFKGCGSVPGVRGYMASCWARTLNIHFLNHLALYCDNGPLVWERTLTITYDRWVSLLRWPVTNWGKGGRSFFLFWIYSAAWFD